MLDDLEHRLRHRTGVENKESAEMALKNLERTYGIRNKSNENGFSGTVNEVLPIVNNQPNVIDLFYQTRTRSQSEK